MIRVPIKNVQTPAGLVISCLPIGTRSLNFWKTVLSLTHSPLFGRLFSVLLPKCVLQCNQHNFRQHILSSIPFMIYCRLSWDPQSEYHHFSVFLGNNAIMLVMMSTTISIPLTHLQVARLHLLTYKSWKSSYGNVKTLFFLFLIATVIAKVFIKIDCCRFSKLHSHGHAIVAPDVSPATVSGIPWGINTDV